MIPYLPPLVLRLPFGLELNAFGVLAAIGTLVGASLAAKWARDYAPGDDEPLREVVVWAVGGGLVGGHLMHVLGYHPELLRDPGPIILLKFWEGLSSMGGVLGALGGIFIYFYRRGLAVRPYLDALALGTAPGWAIARLGCFAVHDHPGVRTDFFLAVAFPGGARHDLGLYDALVLGALTLVLYVLKRFRPPEATLMGVLAVGYSTSRFFLDFLRATDLAQGNVDRRIWGLTPAQYVTMGLFVAGLALLVGALRRRERAPAAHRH